MDVRHQTPLEALRYGSRAQRDHRRRRAISAPAARIRS
jgi:hypothetical protein